MGSAFPNLFRPIQVGRYTLKNRIMNTGHAAHFQTADGLPTQRYVDYVRERARGGVGIIVIGHTVTHYDGEAAASLASYDDRIIPLYARIAEAAHAHAVPILNQLGHRGRRVVDSGGFLQRPLLAPSAIPAPDFSAPQLVPHAMTTGEVEEVVASFGQATRRIVKGALDGVELAVGIDYLFANFLSAQANRRTDRYGGATLAERMSFLNEVIEVVRGELGLQRLLGVRFYDDLVDYSLGLEDYKEVARLLEQAGKVDYFNMWQGIVTSPRSGREHWPSHYYKPGQFAHLPAGLKQVVKLPVVGAGRIDSPAVAERLIAEGKADLVGLARTLIADPHWPNKAREGRTEEIRTCIACTQSCVGHFYLGMGVGCIYNPVTGREAEWAELPRAPRAKRVVVVGGGPAGLEAARVAAERGHRVVLFEQTGRLGGQVKLIARTPGREIFEEIILYFERRLASLGVDVRLGRAAVAAELLAEAPDAVVVATGSTAFRPEFLGAEQRHVLTAREVIEGNAAIGQRVLVVDSQGRPEAPSVAELLADMGREVELVTGLEHVARHMPYPAGHNLLERLMRKGVRLTPYTGVWEVRENAVEAYNVVTWEPRTIADIDTVVLAAGGQPDDRLYHALQGKVPALFAVGDCFQPRDIEVATVDGHRAARAI
ncbi:MAG: FAD-dependent oxidoreductase [Alphaproteobacteria bacterium]|nr:FAD-dependent oxidoreductase [Alphaproteobacteria bacterium]